VQAVREAARLGPIYRRLVKPQQTGVREGSAVKAAPVAVVNDQTSPENKQQWNRSTVTRGKY
jgi:hypothetical protein